MLSYQNKIYEICLTLVGKTLKSKKKEEKKNPLREITNFKEKEEKKICRNIRHKRSALHW